MLTTAIGQHVALVVRGHLVGVRARIFARALRLIVEDALEGEVSDVLGRERYERGEGDKVGYRNG